MFDHSGHESQLKTHSELWQHITRDNKLLTSHSPNSENLSQMLLLLWEQTAMTGQQLLLGTGPGPLWYQQSPVLINISNCCKQQDWFFTCLSVLSGPFLSPQPLASVLEKKYQFCFCCWEAFSLDIWHFTVEIQLPALKEDRKQKSVPNLLADTVNILIILLLC